MRNIVLICAVLLSGCGGSGTNGQASYSEMISYFDTAVVQSENLMLGDKSTSREADGYGEGHINFSRNDLWNPGSSIIPVRNYTSVNQYTRAETVSGQVLPLNHISDTQAAAAWQNGWTGAGQTIAVIDDFSNPSISAASKITVERTHDLVTKVRPGERQNTLSYNHTLEYLSIKNETHGKLVSSIAGGGGAGRTLIEERLMRATNCVDGCWSLPDQLSQGSWQSTSGFSENATVEYTENAGVAKDAFVVDHGVDLTGVSSTTNTLKRLASHMDNSSNFSAINLSLGMNIPTSNTSYSQVLDQVADFSLENFSNAVVVVSAGNSGAPCRFANLNGCNAVAVALTANEKVNKNLIVVGATQGLGLNEEIASYSTRPGFLKSRFLYASGESGYYDATSGKNISGTSFAAPRVTGAAAILRQKFPNLTGAEASTILLKTASKDINGDGFDDFSGISDTFGNGKLNLANALSPIGNLEIN